MFSSKQTLVLADTDASSPQVSLVPGDPLGGGPEQMWLAHAQRLESLGVLASSIVHEFRNLLAVMGANATVAESSTDPKVQEAARDIRRCST